MNEITNKILSVRDELMPEMLLRKRGFTYSACGPFSKNKERIQKLKETRDSRYIYQKQTRQRRLFNMIWLREILRIYLKASYKVLHDKAFNFAKNLKYDRYQRGLASKVYNFFLQKSSWWRS